MSNINLDIKQIRTNIQNTRDKLNKYNEKTGEFFAKMTSVDTVWNDEDTSAFTKTVDEDKESFAELVEAIKKQLTVSETFCDELQAAVDNYFEITTLYSLKYISSTTDRSVEVLNEIEGRINNIKDSVSSLSIPASSSNRTAIYGISSDLDTRQISITKQKIASTVNAINKTIEESRTSASTIGKYEMDNGTISFKSSVQSPELTRAEEVRETQVSARAEIEKAQLDNVGLSSDISTVSFAEKTKQGELDGIEVSQEPGSVRFTAKQQQASLNGEKDQTINSNYDFRDKHENASLDDAKDEEIKEYGFRDKNSSTELSDEAEHEIETFDFQGKTSDISLEEEKDQTIQEYSGPTHESAEILLSEYEPMIENHDYSFNENTREADLQSTTDVSVNNVYSFEDKTSDIAVSDTETTVKSDYNYGGSQANANLADVNVNVDSSYNLRGNTAQANLTNNDTIITGKEYHINDDNIIES